MNLEELHKKFLPDPNDVILVKSLFLHPGWIRYEERIKELITLLNYNINQLTDGNAPVTVENLPMLNEQVAERRMLKLMLLVKEELLQEVDPKYDEPQADKSNFDVDSSQ